MNRSVETHVEGEKRGGRRNRGQAQPRGPAEAPSARRRARGANPRAASSGKQQKKRALLPKGAAVCARE